MNKAQLIDSIAEKSGVSKVNAKKCVDSFIDVAAETLRAGEKITLIGFGTLVVTKKPACVGRNFRTGSPIEIPPKSVIKFRPCLEAL